MEPVDTADRATENPHIAGGRDVTLLGRSGVVPWHSPAPLQQHYERPRLWLLARKVMRRLQEADAVDHEDLEGDHERIVLEAVSYTHLTLPTIYSV